MVYDKLLGRIKEKFGNNKNFAEAMNWSERTLSRKLNNKVNFNQKDILKTCTLLSISKEEIVEFFFTTNVQIN